MKKYFLLASFFAAAIAVSAQGKDPVIMTINGKNITKSEFLYSYNKNNNEATVEKKSLDEYVELFRNFKLWIAEGEAQKIDTSAAFQKDYAEHRAEMAQPYLTAPETDETLLRRQYNRMGEMVNISHILIAYPNFPMVKQTVAADTLELYKKATDVLKQLSKKNAKWADICLKNSYDKSSKENGGLIGWFRGMNLAMPLEDGAFSIEKVGGYSLVRSDWGYHIIRLNARKPYPGQFHAAHILIECSKDADTVQVAEAEKKIWEIYEKATTGTDFGELSREFSADRSVAQNGGDLGWFESNKMVPEFSEVVENTPDGEISKPFRTNFGFHIVKKFGVKPFTNSFEAEAPGIETLLNNFGFYIPAHRTGIEKLKQANKFSKNTSAYEKLFNRATNLFPTDSTFTAEYSNDASTLFEIDGNKFTVADFITWLKANQRAPYYLSTDFLADRLDNYELKSLNKVREDNLDSQYPEFHYLMQEYRDGTILFEVKNREVWDKASTDTAGLEQYFEQNRKDTTYQWKAPHFKGYVVLCKDADNRKKMQKETKKMKPEEAVRFLLDNYKVGDVSYVKIEKGLFEAGDNQFVDKQIFKKGTPEFPQNYSDFFLIGKKLKQPESYDDVRGKIISNYQDYLDKQGVERLLKKFPVTINYDVVNTLR